MTTSNQHINHNYLSKWQMGTKFEVVIVFLVSTMLQLASTLGTYFKISSNSYAHRALDLMAHPCHTIQGPFSHAQLSNYAIKSKKKLNWKGAALVPNLQMPPTNAFKKPKFKAGSNYGQTLRGKTFGPMLHGYVSRTRVCKRVCIRICDYQTTWYVKGVYTGSYPGIGCAANPKPRH